MHTSEAGRGQAEWVLCRICLEIYYDVLPILRRKIAAMFANPDDVEDVLQETFERIYRRGKDTEKQA